MKYFFGVGIDKYRPGAFGSQNIDLKQCVNDVQRAEAHFVQQSGQIQHLHNEDAIKGEILTNLRYYAEKLQSGDTLIYYQSSHGTNWYESDGKVTTARLAHDGVIADHEIASIWATVKKGVTVVTFSDLCFAESSQRDVNLPDWKARSMEYRGAIPQKPTTLPVTYRGEFWHVSASRFDQVSWETSTGGVFTTLLLAILSQTKGERSLTAVFNTVKRNIQRQEPVLEKINPKRSAPKI